FADDAVGFEPEADALVVIVAAAAPSVAGKNRVNLRSEGSVGQRSPSAAGTALQLRGGQRQVLPILLGSPEPALGIQHQADVLRQTFINPKQGRLAGSL